jgi:Ca2+-binding RTX toxin-like protein
MVANPDSQRPDPQPVTREPSGVRDTDPAWTPDSDQVGGWQQNPGTIVFARANQIFTVGGGPMKGPKQPRAITSTRFVASHPDWQPRCSNDKPQSGGVIRGTNGPDLLCGGPGNDVIYGNGGDDRIFAGNGHDVVQGGPGNDFILGGIGTAGDNIDGGTGNDFILGSPGPDRITDFGPNSGNDTIAAEAGTDDLVAWDNVKGNDTIDGGDGSDVCVVDNTDQGHTKGSDNVWSCETPRLPSQIERLEAQPAPSMP